AQVTPGWWADKIITPNQVGMVGKKCAFRGVLELTYADGSVKRYGTDTSHWKAGIAGPVTHAAIFDGEYYDARIKPGYATPEKLGTPEVNTEFNGEILPSAGAEIYLRPDLTLKPVKSYVWKGIDGAGEEAYGKVHILREFKAGSTLGEGETLVVDFGQNCAGVPAFTFKAKEGTVLTCLPAEILNDGNGAKSRGMDGPEGSCHRTNLRAHANSFVMQYTFGKEGVVTYHPRCTFFGYRYISVTATAPVKILSVESIPVTSIAASLETGTLKTGNDLINKLISNTVWGQRSNYLSVPTDCPQRNERLGWTADTQVFTETGTFFADTKTFFHKWMRDMRDSQSPTGSFPGVAPVAQYGGSQMRLGWADAGIIVPWTIWKQFADTQIVEENWDAMVRYLAHVSETKFAYSAIRNECGNGQYADWLSYEPLESAGHSAQYKDAKGKWQPLPETIVYWDYLGACYWLMDAEMMREMAEATGRDGWKYACMAEEAKAYLRGSFFDKNGLFSTDILNTMQTPALFALRCDLVSGAARDAMIARLRQNFADHGGCLQTGFLGTSILMQTLTENGMADIAWDLLFQRKNPSWLYSVDNGATTIWERWNSYTIEKGMGPKGMNSFNHYAYGCVCQWIWETAAGICADPASPGFKHIIMKPIPDKRLGSMDASFRSAAGLIKSEWHYDGSTWVWTFTIPAGATATVTLPGETESKEYSAGTYTVRK
ncbi:MAG: family 78 glycoside hydrolase catalytic domain, partial [Bacteroidales bacterium]|nr:family 78 glycoside hydrolase catalytic domain [Bacteroidales bacterium]